MLINHDSANYFDLSTCNSDLGAVTVTSHDPDWPDPGLRGSLSARSRPTVEKKTRVELTPDFDGENHSIFHAHFGFRRGDAIAVIAIN